MAESEGENDGVPATSRSLVGSLRRIFRPLARLLIARSIPFPLAANLLRGAYVAVAEREFPVSGKKQTDSRITLLTGVHRKDVKRLRQQRERAPVAPRAAALGSQLIARWTTLPEYVDEDGVPRPLPRLAATGGEQSFESLVRSVNTDIRPRAVLDEWLRRGLVSLDDDGRVCLNVQAFIPSEGSDEMAYFFGRNLHDHLAAAVHNVLGEPKPFLERSVNYNNLGSDAVAELTALAHERGMAALQELNARALQLQQRDSGQPGSSHRFDFGVYVFSEIDPRARREEPAGESTKKSPKPPPKKPPADADE